MSLQVATTILLPTQTRKEDELALTRWWMHPCTCPPDSLVPAARETLRSVAKAEAEASRRNAAKKEKLANK